MLTTIIVISVVASLVLSVLAFYGMLQVRNATLDLVRDARTILSGLPSQQIETTVRLNHSFPIAADVPLQESFTVPIQTTIPIDTVAQVPIEIPLFGTYELDVPVYAEVPINLQVVIPVNQTVSIDTEVTLDTEVPVELQVGQMGMEGVLQQLDQTLSGLEEQLNWLSLPGETTTQ
jgi:hypothetical protein